MKDPQETTGNARDREMGRENAPLGDRGHSGRTWTPPEDEQGISNQPDDRAAVDVDEVDDQDEDAGQEQRGVGEAEPDGEGFRHQENR